ncbi:MAG: maleamate amidohydrolase [Bradyrhizobium sp.]|jgi:maleamate amidohydrolase|nr:maleamate amidohydrolase [Bradyrhizobium sp.]
MSSDSAADNYKGVWDGQIGFGDSPALLVIDFMKGYTTEGSPLYAPGVVRAVKESGDLLLAARQASVPILHTIIRYHASHFSDGGTWVRKAPVMRSMVDGHPDAEICDEVRPLPSEIVVRKQYASAFFGTSIAATLTALRVDTIVLIGCSTSGCIRASAVDSTQHGFRTIVVRECVGDRHPGPHEANLFDIHSKYGDVVSKDEAIAHFRSRHCA